MRLSAPMAEKTEGLIEGTIIYRRDNALLSYNVCKTDRQYGKKSYLFSLARGTLS